MGVEKNRMITPPAGRYVVAVSGGVDSVVLLDMIAKLAGDYELIVAHFDHGIRPDSASDCEFVASLADKYGLKFESRREELGAGASEELARERRYEFLRSVVGKYSAKLTTAHHSDDIIETAAINLTRGTGWRGLAVMDGDVVRPLLDVSKQEVLEYAKAHGLQWREDSTNASDNYLRNRIRRRATRLDGDDKRQVLALRAQQVAIKKQIDQETRRLVGDQAQHSRYFFTHQGDRTALECLRFVTNEQLTRPQLERALGAIKTARTGSIYQAGAGVDFKFTTRNFTVELIK